MNRIALVLTGLVGTLAATAPAQPKAPSAPAAPVVTKETAAVWVKNFGKLNIKQGQLTTLGRAEPRAGC